MTELHLNHGQAKALARFINQLRGDWDVPGIEHFLGQARMHASAADLAIAAIRASQSAANRSPAVIPLDGAHWRSGEVSKPPARRPPPRHELCSLCGFTEPACRLRFGHDHEFRALTAFDADPTTGELPPQVDHSAHAAAVRAALRAATSRPEPDAPAADPSTPTPEPASSPEGDS